MNDTIDEQEELIQSFETDPNAFIEIFLERKLSPKQFDFIEKTKVQKHLLAIWSRQTGKSTVIAAYVVWRLLYGKGCVIEGAHMNEQIAIIAPIQEQYINLYNKIESLLRKHPALENFFKKISSKNIIAKNGNRADFMSASPGSHIRGYTATCIVIDESQDITDNKYSADILPFGSTTNALVIEAGTPKTKNHFYRTIEALKRMNAVVYQKWFECPFISKDFVMRQKDTSPAALWRQEYLNEFVEEGVLAFPSKLFEPEMKLGKMTGRWNLADYNYLDNAAQLTSNIRDRIIKENQEGARRVAGLDLGKQNDNSIFSILREDVRPIRYDVLLKFPLETGYTEVARIISMFYPVYEPYEFNIDYTNEKSFVEHLQNFDVPVVVNKKNDRGAVAFTNKNKSEMINNCRMFLERYQFQLPKTHEQLISEFLNQQYEMTSNNKIIYYHPTNTNDDSLWSTLLALKNLSLLSVEEITSFVNPWEKKHDNRIHGETKESVKECLTANREKRYRHRNMSAEQKRIAVRSRW